MRVVDFSDGFESSSAPSTSVISLTTGSSASPVSVVAGTGIVPSGVGQEDIYVVGSGGAVDISANPQISAGTAEGQILTIIGTSDTNTVLLENGNGLQLNGPATLTNAAVIRLRWDVSASVWTEISRNGMA